MKNNRIFLKKSHYSGFPKHLVKRHYGFHQNTNIKKLRLGSRFNSLS